MFCLFTVIYWKREWCLSVHSYADHNAIVDVIDLGKESYMRQNESFIPFATTKNVQQLYVFLVTPVIYNY